jgi:VanZ family protein
MFCSELNNSRDSITEGREKRVMRTLLILYCVFIVYGSFIPFKFSTDLKLAGENLSRIQVYPFQDGKKKFSIPDVVSNVLLFAPFGFLFVSSSLRATPDRSWGIAGMAGVGSALVFSTAIEIGQLFTLDRTTSPLDVAANTVGATVGAMAAHRFLWSGGLSLEGRITTLLYKEPLLLPLGLLGLSIAADNFYPFAITLDVSTIKNSLKHAQWVPFETFGHRFWADLLMDKGLTFALFAALLHRVTQGYWPAIHSARKIWLITAIIAAVLETGKVFFVGRSPKLDNLMLAMLGALAGVTLVPLIVRSRPVRAYPELTLLGLATALLVYAELTPFDFALGATAVAAKAGRIEWLPFTSYYGAETQSTLFDLWNKVLLSGFFGFATSAATSRRQFKTAAAGCLLGGLLEAAQVLTVSRTPSITDIFIFGVGAYLGGTCHSRYASCTSSHRTFLTAKAPRVPIVHPTQKACLAMQEFHDGRDVLASASDSMTQQTQ